MYRYSVWVVKIPSNKTDRTKLLVKLGYARLGYSNKDVLRQKFCHRSGSTKLFKVLVALIKKIQVKKLFTINILRIFLTQ